MQIHTVKKDETLYGIARRYGVPVTKILADNDLLGDRLTTGEDLIVIKPTKTVTVKGGDTLDLISRRFGVKKSSVIRNNPFLLGRDKLRPGQILTVKHDDVKIGVGSILGYAEKGCRRDKLKKALPYLTYLTVSCASIKNDTVIPTFSPTDVKDAAESSGKVVILGITDESSGGFLSTKESYERIITDAISLAKEHGFMGISISCEKAADLCPEAYCEFLLETRKRLIGCNMLLFSEIFDETPTDASEISDGAVLNTRLIPIKNTVEYMRRFSEKAESSKVFVRGITGTTLSDRSLSAEEIKELCYRSGKEILTDEGLVSYFDHIRYRVGKGETIRLSFPSLRYTKAKLEALYELGFMGIAYDIDSVPISNLTTFNSMFARADYSLA